MDVYRARHRHRWRTHLLPSLTVLAIMCTPALTQGADGEEGGEVVYVPARREDDADAAPTEPPQRERSGAATSR